MARSLAKLISVALIVAGVSACANAAADSARATFKNYTASVDAQIAGR